MTCVPLLGLNYIFRIRVILSFKFFFFLFFFFFSSKKSFVESVAINYYDTLQCGLIYYYFVIKKKRVKNWFWCNCPNDALSPGISIWDTVIKMRNDTTCSISRPAAMSCLTVSTDLKEIWILNCILMLGTDLNYK